jgi:hypothetical protein
MDGSSCNQFCELKARFDLCAAALTIAIVLLTYKESPTKGPRRAGGARRACLVRNAIAEDIEVFAAMALGVDRSFFFAAQPAQPRPAHSATLKKRLLTE